MLLGTVLAGCGGPAAGPAVGELRGAIAAWLSAEHPATWLSGGGGGGGGSTGLGGTTSLYDWGGSIEAHPAPANTAGLVEGLREFVLTQIQARGVGIRGRSSGSDSFGFEYEIDGARGGIRVFAHRLADGDYVVDVHQYEVR
jgi:hypothetical protein